MSNEVKLGNYTIKYDDIISVSKSITEDEYLFWSKNEMEIHAIIALENNVLKFYSGWAVKYSIKDNVVHVQAV